MRECTPRGVVHSRISKRIITLPGITFERTAKPFKHFLQLLTAAIL